jgi:hypothetical protein
MKTSRISTQKLFATISAFTMLGAFGCVSDLSEPLEPEYGFTATNATMEQALELIADEMGLDRDGTMGTLDDRDEEPAFGSDVFRAEFRPDGTSRDRGDLAAEPDVRDRLDREDVHVFNILAVWGRIRPNDNEAIALRWNPSISVMEGDRVRVRRTVRFERRDLVLPSDARNEVNIISSTMQNVDGVILQVAITATDADSGFFVFRSGPLSVRIPSARSLHDLNRFTVIDQAGNGLMLTAIERPDNSDVCHHGFMSGRWANTRHNGGVFGGQLLSADGEQVGHLVGRFGGGRFHGKVIGLDGRFRGLIAGAYDEGAYRGEIYDGDGLAIGSMRGHYTVADEGGHGRFRGGWTQNCDDDRPTGRDAGDGEVPPTDERPTDERSSDERSDDDSDDDDDVEARRSR